MDYAAKGDEALAQSNAPLAFEHFTRALIQHPRSPQYYIQRATACGRLKPEHGGPNSSLALHDSEIALVLAVERGKRELILAAQFRRAVSLFQLERYGDASYLFKLLEEKSAATKNTQDDSKEAKLQTAMKGGKGNLYETQLPIWMMKADRKLKELPEGEAKANVSVVEYPKNVSIPGEEQLKAELAGKLGTPASVLEQSAQATAAPSAASDTPRPAASSATPPTPAVPEKVRHEWYQSQDSVVVTLYVKNVPKGKVETDLKDDSLSLQFPLPSGSAYDFTLDPLYAPIDASTSKVSVMGTKIEITLQKKTPGQKWGSLEGSSESVKLTQRPAASTASAGPSYPTSSRHGTKDWDKVASNLTTKTTKKEDGKDDGNESDGSDVGGDAVDGFFKKLYKGADDDTRRAMMKSYIESNGTSLSTNWSEVGSKTMEPHPPS
ncbi:D-site 20S pre-rRNA nuclease [Penicillium atrosanguineum]|uniref:D-site 20S pre-rRNA nuclease n=1 Tax=Penicillium atrosanguineum TaxID=1132637 RepID=UPI002387EE37|nr:D-site 20S pre-rRNA nuclease [Penicillium atrosanguineum]KAJ5304306.1 D-site 20S pre-rRNA nuclease [Penicillium atrosanguineum]